MRPSRNCPTWPGRPARFAAWCLLWSAASVAGVSADDSLSPPPAPAAAQTALSLGLDPVRLARIDGLVGEAIAAGEMSGCVVAIGRRAGTAWMAAFGDRQVNRPASR